MYSHVPAHGWCEPGGGGWCRESHGGYGSGCGAYRPKRSARHQRVSTTKGFCVGDACGLCYAGMETRGMSMMSIAVTWIDDLPHLPAVASLPRFPTQEGLASGRQGVISPGPVNEPITLFPRCLCLPARPSGSLGGRVLPPGRTVRLSFCWLSENHISYPQLNAVR